MLIPIELEPLWDKAERRHKREAKRYGKVRQHIFRRYAGVDGNGYVNNHVQPSRTGKSSRAAMKERASWWDVIK